MYHPPSDFTTPDLALVSTLNTLDIHADRIDHTDPRKNKFLFVCTPMLEKTINDYFAQCLRVGPTTFFVSIKAIKTRINHT